MRSLKKIAAAAAAAAMCAAILTACGDKVQTDEATADTAAAQPAIVTTAADVNAVDPAEPFDLAGGVTDKMYNRAIMNEGDLVRLAAAMKKAQSGGSLAI